MNGKNGKTAKVETPEVTTPEVTTPEVTTPEVTEAQKIAQAQAAKDFVLETAMRDAGATDDEISAVFGARKAKAAEIAKSKLEQSAHIAGLRKELEGFGAAVRVVVEFSGNADQKSTLRITFPKSGTTKTANMGHGGSRGKACIVNGIQYSTCQAACTAHRFDTQGNSAKRVLEAADKSEKIESFVLVNA